MNVYGRVGHSKARGCLRAETGDYANHVTKSLEKGRLTYQVLFVFFTLHTQFIDIFSVIPFMEAGKAVPLAAEQ